MSDIKRYVKCDKNGNPIEYNAKYVTKDIGEDLFKKEDIQKQFILFLSGPESQKIKNNLKIPEILPYEFTSKDIQTKGQKFKGTIEIIVVAVNE